MKYAVMAFLPLCAALAFAVPPRSVERHRPVSQHAGESSEATTGTCGDEICEPEENFSSCPADCHSLNDRTNLFVDLSKPLFSAVDEGVFLIFEADDCANVPRCFYNNPTSPYGIPIFPLAPREPDPDPLNISNRPPEREDLYSNYRLLPNEAIVWIGRTPPECPYFSFTAYVFSRYKVGTTNKPPYADRALIFASVGESENQVTMKTSAAPGEPPFDQESVVIMTADRATDAMLRDVLVRSGFPESVINTLVIPRFKADRVTPHVILGFENEADAVAALMRIADPDALVPGSPIRQWLDNTQSRVFRVRPSSRTRLDPIPMPPPRPQGDGESERGASLIQLVRSIQDAHCKVGTQTRVAWPKEAAHGDFCLEHLTPCNADCRDTPYMATSFRLGEEPDSIIVSGRNHEIIGKAAYVNITATRVTGGTAFYSVVMPELAGSAKVYLPNHPDAENLWQMKFARRCNGEPFCYELTEDQIPIDGMVAILVRAYLDPATGTSPKVFPAEESELVFPRVIKIGCESGCD